MHDRRDRLVAVVESGDDAPASVLRKIEAVPFDVDVVLVLLVPVRDHRRLVAQGAPQTLLNLAGACTFGDGAEDRTDPGAACDRVPSRPARKMNGTVVKVAIRATLTMVAPTPEKGVTTNPIASSTMLRPPKR